LFHYTYFFTEGNLVENTHFPFCQAYKQIKIIPFLEKDCKSIKNLLIIKEFFSTFGSKVEDFFYKEYAVVLICCHS